MIISEAVKKAMETGGKIRRDSFHNLHVWIEPTNTPNGFIIHSTVSKRPPSRWWQPLTTDLIADDWEVVN